MNSVVLNKNFGIENLSLVSGPTPEPADDELLVRMKTAAVNYVDLAVVTGKLDPAIRLPFIPVADGAGIVESVGKGIQGFKPGDRVATLYIPSWPGGRYRQKHTPLASRPGAGSVPGQLAEYKTFREHEVIRMPDTLSFAEASTLPSAGLTPGTLCTSCRTSSYSRLSVVMPPQRHATRLRAISLLERTRWCVEYSGSGRSTIRQIAGFSIARCLTDCSICTT